MSDVSPSESGLASGVVNTAFMMGGALGLASLASLAAFRTNDLLASGNDQLVALNGGYHAAFFVGAFFAALAAVVGAALLRVSTEAASAPDNIVSAVVVVVGLLAAPHEEERRRADRARHYDQGEGNAAFFTVFRFGGKHFDLLLRSFNLGVEFLRAVFAGLLVVPFDFVLLSFEV